MYALIFFQTWHLQYLKKQWHHHLFFSHNTFLCFPRKCIAFCYFYMWSANCIVKYCNVNWKHYADVGNKNLSMYRVMYLKDRKCCSLLLQSCVYTVVIQTFLIFSAYSMYRMSVISNHWMSWSSSLSSELVWKAYSRYSVRFVQYYKHFALFLCLATIPCILLPQQCLH